MPRLGSQQKKRDIWLYSIFAIYILLLVWVVICKAQMSLPGVRHFRNYNFIPFYNGESAIFPVFDVVANVIVFLPLGIYLGLFHVKFPISVVIGFLISLLFELTQYAFAIGVADITDLITNTTGTFFGMILYILLCRIFSPRDRLDKILKITASVCTALAMLYFAVALVRHYWI